MNYVCRLGAAVVVETGNFSLKAFSRIYYNPLCFLQYFSEITPPDEFNRVIQLTIYCIVGIYYKGNFCEWAIKCLQNKYLRILKMLYWGNKKSVPLGNKYLLDINIYK